MGTTPGGPLSGSDMLFLFMTAAHAAPDPERLLADARREVRDDDFAAARESAREALEIPGEHATEARFLMAVAWQLDGSPARALTLYHDTLADQPHTWLAPQITAGIAECLAETGDLRGALRTLRQAEPFGSPGIQHDARIEVDEALWKAQRRLRRSRELLAVLERTDHDLATLQQAGARTWLVHTWLDAADALGVRDPAMLARRAALIDAAELQLRATIDHDHAVFTLDQLQRLGLSYEVLGDDVVSVHGGFSGMPADARRQAESAWVKASRIYDMGVRHAGRSFRDEDAIGMGIAQELVRAKVEALDADRG